jgi:hypothetical protein
MYKASSLNANSNTLESDRSRHDCPIACVIAQQYSSATFVSLRIHSRKEKFGARFKIVTILFLFLNIVGLKLRNLKLRGVGECI